MSFYVRYYLTDENDLSLAQLAAGLQEFDPAYSLPHEGNSGEIRYAGESFAEIDVNRPGDALFDEELAETLDGVQLTGGARAQHVLDLLRQTRATLALRILWQGRDVEQTLTKIDPVVVWLMMNRDGLLHVDGEGFYEGEDLIFEME